MPCHACFRVQEAEVAVVVMVVMVVEAAADAKEKGYLLVLPVLPGCAAGLERERTAFGMYIGVAAFFMYIGVAANLPSCVRA